MEVGDDFGAIRALLIVAQSLEVPALKVSTNLETSRVVTTSGSHDTEGAPGVNGLEEVSFLDLERLTARSTSTTLSFRKNSGWFRHDGSYLSVVLAVLPRGAAQLPAYTS